MWFGYQSDPNATVAWGARAIFHPGESICLDILHDRQGYQGEENETLWKPFLKEVNAILPAIDKMCRNFYANSSESFRWTFPWPHDPNLVLSAAGSPNASYGYFYLSVSLVPKDKAQPDIRPHGYDENEKSKRKSRVTSPAYHW